MFKNGWSQLMGILCLSETASSTLMWSHYGSDHEGYVLGFDSTHDVFNPCDEGIAGLGKLCPVNYSKKRFFIGEQGRDSNFADFGYEFQKGIDWAYEKEWRLTVPLDSSVKINDSLFVWPFKPETLCEVVIGFRTAPDLKKEIVGLCSRFPWIKVHYARPSATTYQMVLEGNPTPSII